ncbi:SIR2 family NAD-dependent protein deacylase [Flavobacterium panacagri]|uniref:SIR2 family NAD-dependent protein deacylase n=1 Tax=Flavobacterium panacagri TaxID=3034146 RepID=UPI0025A5B4DB|nr:SIR2 family protein [Flavobacterium panacagri]
METKFKGIIPRELIEAIKKNKCVLFVGSGLSAQVERSNGKNLPNWGNFLEELLAFGIDKNISFWNDPSHIKEMINKGNYLMAAQELQECIGKGEFSDFLSQIFRDANVKPQNVHNLICEIPFRALITSNYDALLEGAYAITNAGRIPQKFTQEDLKTISTPLRKDNFFIFKIHGDIDRSETIILGSRSYTNLLFRTPEYLSFLETLFTTHSVLFIGFGGSDPDLDYILDRLSTIFSRTLDKHFILLPFDKFNLTEKRRLLLDRRLEVIDYDKSNNHGEIEIFLNDLKIITTNCETNNEQIIPKTSKNILIICSSGEERLQKQVSERIQSNGHKYSGWLFAESFEERLIYKHFKKIQIGLVLITKNSIQSNTFHRELEYVILQETEEKIKLVIVVIGDVEVPRVLMNKSFIKISRMDDNGWEKILYHINQI